MSLEDMGLIMAPLIAASTFAVLFSIVTVNQRSDV